MKDDNLTVDEAKYEEKEFFELDKQEQLSYAENYLVQLAGSTLIGTATAAYVLQIISNPATTEEPISTAVVLTLLVVGCVYYAYDRHTKLTQILETTLNGDQE